MDAIRSGQPFHCVICLELVYKPIVQACGHLFCFWCVHQAMNSSSESYCPLCRRPYMYFPRICEQLHFFLLKALPLEYGSRAKEVKEEEKRRGVFSPQFEGECTSSDELSKSDSHTHPQTAPSPDWDCGQPGALQLIPPLDASPSVDVSIMTGADSSGRAAREFIDSSPMAGGQTSAIVVAPAFAGGTSGAGILLLRSPEPDTPWNCPSPLAMDFTGAQLVASAAFTSDSNGGALDLSSFVANESRSPTCDAGHGEAHSHSEMLSTNPEVRPAPPDSTPVLLSGSTTSASGIPSRVGRAVEGNNSSSLSSSGEVGSAGPENGDGAGFGIERSTTEANVAYADRRAGSPSTEVNVSVLDNSPGDARDQAPATSHRDTAAGAARYGGNSQILQNLFRTYEFVREGLFPTASESNPGPGFANSQQHVGELARPDRSSGKGVQTLGLSPPPPNGTELEVGCSSIICSGEEVAILPRLLAAASLSDFLCSACNQLLHRPVVLNCGHAYCRLCVVQSDCSTMKCPSCGSFHPAGEPQVCLELHYFLELAFLQEYALRQEEQSLHEEQRRLDKASTSMDDIEDPVSSSKEENREPVHRGIGCDGCGMMPIVGRRFHCEDCPKSIGYDLCGNCHKSAVALTGRFNQRHGTDHHMVEMFVRHRSSMPRLLRESMEILQNVEEDVSRPRALGADGFEDAEVDPDEVGEHSQDEGDIEFFSVVYHA